MANITTVDLGNVRGATGPQGPKGDTGAMGPQGPKGDRGDPAQAPVTSVNGMTGAVRVVETVAAGPNGVSSRQGAALTKSVSSARMLLVQPISDISKLSSIILVGPFTDSVDYTASQISTSNGSWIRHITVYFTEGGTKIWCRGTSDYAPEMSGSGSSFGFYSIYAIF